MLKWLVSFGLWEGFLEASLEAPNLRREPGDTESCATSAIREHSVDQIGLFEKRYIATKWHGKKSHDLAIGAPKS